MGWPDIHWPARDPGWAGGSHWALCFDNLMISLFRQLCDTLCPVVRSNSLPMEGGQLLLGWSIALHACGQPLWLMQLSL